MSEGVAAVAIPARRQRRRMGISGHAGWWFVAPFLLAFAVAVLAPVAYAIYLSLFKNQLVGGNHFVGFANYRQVVTDSLFWAGMLRVLGFLVVQVPVMLLLALIAAGNNAGDSKVYYVDTTGWLTSSDFYSDGIHPTPQGHTLIADHLVPIIDGSGYVRFENDATGLYIDGMGRTCTSTTWAALPTAPISASGAIAAATTSSGRL